MQLITNHLVLVSADTQEKACFQVEEFFKNTLLVRYDKIEINTPHCYSANDSEFHKSMQKGIKANEKTLEKFIGEFQKTGFKTINDLYKVKCGYPSKLLHIITHFLDGFIGIDSTFYNLHEDSHWVSEETQKAIDNYANSYWVIQLSGYSETPEEVSLVQT